jgi:uncharacterized protein YjbI with pentapeptide repeats
LVVTDTLSVTTKRQILARFIMSKILSKMKSVGLNLTLLFCICLSLLPLRVPAQPIIDFSWQTIKEPINIGFWRRHHQEGIEIKWELGFPSAWETGMQFPPTHVIFYRPIDFTGATFESEVSFNSAAFNSTADFVRTNFQGRADFREARFDSSVSFWGGHFGSTAGFLMTNFKGTANFDSATFYFSVNFYDAEFDSTADFDSTEFIDMADFSWAWFSASISFHDADFYSMADFSATRFNGMADFSMVTFDSNSTVLFSGTRFSGKVDFRGARFWGNVVFSNDTLPDYLDFRYVKDISREIDFTLSLLPRSKGKCHIALAGADISKIKLSGALFELSFPIDTIWGKTTAGKDTIERIDSTSYDGQLSVYESVLKKLKDDGFMESYQILDIAYRRFKYEHGGFFDWYILNTAQKWWWNYGYSKERVFLLAIGLWVLFSLVNLKAYPKLSESVYTIGFLEKIQESAYTGIKKWIFYALQVVSYTAIVFFGLKMDVAKFKKGVVREHPWLFIYLMVVYVVGLVCLGFIVNIIFTR